LGLPYTVQNNQIGQIRTAAERVKILGQIKTVARGWNRGENPAAIPQILACAFICAQVQVQKPSNQAQPNHPSTYPSQTSHGDVCFPFFDYKKYAISIMDSFGKMIANLRAPKNAFGAGFS
jgi:hypothetical protein